MDTHRRRGDRQSPGGGGCSPDMHACAEHAMRGSPHRVSITTVRWVCTLVITLAMLGRANAAECPANKCDCEWNTDGRFVVNCRDVPLTMVPTWINSTIDIYEVTLANNHITDLDANAFSGLKIKRLDLSGNQITSIHPQAFAGLERSLNELLLHVNAMDQFPREALAGLINLRELLVDGFNLPSLGMGALTTLNKLHTLKLERCQLESVMKADISASKDSLVWLSLRENKLSSIHQNVLSQLRNLEILDLAHNKIIVMPDNLFSGNAKISKLDLSNNQLDTIRPSAYRGLEASLVVLILQNNKLTDNQLQPHKVLTAIRDVNLANNQIGAIHMDSFLNAQAMENITLRANKLTALRKLPFKPVLGSLKKLELAENKITYIEPGFFSEFKALATLDLSDQMLHSVINADTFSGLEGTLQRLSMQKNGLVSSDLVTISNLTSLQSLDVEGNSIERIPDWTFAKLSQLVRLDISYNSITNVSQLSMVGMKERLDTINLIDNKLETVPECTFSGFTALKQIKLNQNPLRCDCDMVWLWSWVDLNLSKIQKRLLNWTCASPIALYGTKLHTVSKSQLCPGGHTPAQCEDIIPTTTLPTPIQGSSTFTPSQPKTVKATNISHNAALVRWTTWESTTIGYNVEVRERTNFNIVIDEDLPPGVKQYWLRKLVPGMNYTVCVTSIYNGNKPDMQWCEDFRTGSEPATVTAGGNIGAIVGALVGLLIVIALLVLLGVLVVRSRNSGDPLFARPKWLGGRGHMNNAKARIPTGIPPTGRNSKRFSRPRTACTASTTSSQLQLQQNSANSDLEMKLAGFSAEERGRIISMLTTTGGSTISMISSGSAQRYVPELPPRPQELEGYLNPKSVHDDEDDPEMHVYDEIPGANANYYEEPISSKYQQRRKSTESVHSGKYENPHFHSSLPKPDGACHI